MRRSTAGQVCRAALEVHNVGTEFCSSNRFMNTLDPPVRSIPRLNRPRNGMSLGNRILKEILHFVEQENRIVAAGQKPLRKAEFLNPFRPIRLVPPIVRFADAVEFHLQLAGQGPAELGLAGPRRTVNQDVDAPFARLQSALDQAFDVVAAFTDMIEVRPFEFARGTHVEQ